jgi:hypothetical protein
MFYVIIIWLSKEHHEIIDIIFIDVILWTLICCEPTKPFRSHTLIPATSTPVPVWDDVCGLCHVCDDMSAHVPARDEVEFGLDPGCVIRSKPSICDLMLRTICSGHDSAPNWLPWRWTTLWERSAAVGSQSSHRDAFVVHHDAIRPDDMHTLVCECHAALRRFTRGPFINWCATPR